MNVIEQTVEPKNGAIDLHVDVPAEWEGKRIRLRITFEEEKDMSTVKPKSDLTRFEGKFAHLPDQEKDRILHDLDAIRNEWTSDF